MADYIDREAGIVVFDLSRKCTEELLRETFGAHGEIVDVFIRPPIYGRPGRGFAFVTFSDRSAVAGALAAAPSHIGEDEVKVEARTVAKPRPPAAASPSIYIKGLDATADEDAVRAAVEAFGAVANVEMSADRGFAFVEFEGEEFAQAAVDAQPLSVSGVLCDVEFRTSVARGRGGKGGGGGRAPRAKREPAPREANSIYLKGVPDDCQEEDITAALAGFGTCVSASHRDGKDFAFAVFDAAGGMEAAVAAGTCQVGSEYVTIEARN